MNRTICWTGSLFGKHLELPVGYYGSAKSKQKNAKGTVGPLQTEKIQRARNYWIVTVHRKIPEKFDKPDTVVSGGKLTRETTGVWTPDINILKMADSRSKGR